MTSQSEQQARAEAERANRLKDEFLATVSHELRTPLNAVLGLARMLTSKQVRGERVEHAIGTIERNAAWLAHIINDLLDVSRIVAGKLSLVSEPVDLAALSRSAVDLVRAGAAAKRIDMQFSADVSAIAMVNGDADRLKQVIVNLLTNAIKFTPDGGRVDVSVARVGAEMEVKAADTGTGISAEFLPHVFERFSQADAGTTRRHGGLGLGLAIVRQLVELQGGSVQATSEGEGRGATFTVRLPIKTADRPAGRWWWPRYRERRSPSITPAPTAVQRLDGMRVLVVDDNVDGRSLTALLLTKAGASVEDVASAHEALQIVERSRPDVLVTDISLPDEDGYSLLRRIREHEATQGGCLPVIALTGYAHPADRVQVLAAGFEGHVAKPVKPTELIETIAALTLVRNRG
jgi:CheY-like chemotaxis protein